MSKLSDFISIKHGFAFKGEFITTEENANCLITPVNFSIGGGFKSDKFKYYTGEIPEKYILQPNDLIVTMTDLSKQADTLGYPALVPNISGKKMLHNQRIGLVEFLNNELDKEYLYFLMRTKEYRHQILSTATGATVHHTSPSKILDFEFEKPDLQTQKLIAQYLMILEEKIQLNIQTNQTLEAIAQAIFKSWFVDFDPVRAKAQAISDGKTSDEANLSAMAVISGKAIEDLSQTEYQQLWEIADAFPSELVENAEFGEVPKGWEVRKIENIIKKIPTGKKYSQKTVEETGKVPVLDQGKSGLIGFHNDEAGVKASIENPVIVFANHTCYMRLISYDFSAIQNVFAFRGNELDIYWIYLATLGKQEFTEYKGHFPDFLIKEVIVPTTELTTLFGNFIKYQFMNIFKNDKQNKILSEMRDLLLPKLLSGELLNE